MPVCNNSRQFGSYLASWRIVITTRELVKPQHNANVVPRIHEEEYRIWVGIGTTTQSHTIVNCWCFNSHSLHNNSSHVYHQEYRIDKAKYTCTHTHIHTDKHAMCVHCIPMKLIWVCIARALTQHDQLASAREKNREYTKNIQYRVINLWILKFSEKNKRHCIPYVMCRIKYSLFTKY